MLPFGQEKSPSNTISTWTFIIPIPQAKNIKVSWQGVEKGRGASLPCCVCHRLMSAALSCGLQKWFKPFCQTAPSSSCHDHSLILPLIDPALSLILFCVFSFSAFCKPSVFFYNRLVHYHLTELSFSLFFLFPCFRNTLNVYQWITHTPSLFKDDSPSLQNLKTTSRVTRNMSASVSVSTLTSSKEPRLQVANSIIKPTHMGFPGGLVIKNQSANAGDVKSCRFDPWVKKTPWRKAWQPTPVLLSAESHG